MFEAIVLVCAATLANGPEAPCISFEYTKHKLFSREQCGKALDEVKAEIDSDEVFQYYLWETLGRPEMLARSFSCQENDEIST